MCMHYLFSVSDVHMYVLSVGCVHVSGECVWYEDCGTVYVIYVMYDMLSESVVDVWCVCSKL